jgi:hypothetical protein
MTLEKLFLQGIRAEKQEEIDFYLEIIFSRGFSRTIVTVHNVDDTSYLISLKDIPFIRNKEIVSSVRPVKV